MGSSRRVPGRVLLVGSDCSGLESLLKALESMSIPHNYVFGSDISKAARRTLRQNYGKNHLLFKDLTVRDQSTVPGVDIYHAGFPCQPFSMAGKGQGVGDPRGQVIYGILDYIQQQHPRLVILENVKGLVLRHKGLIRHILRALRRAGYHTTYKILNARFNGVPHNRERVFILGFWQGINETAGESFQWPPDLPPVDLQSFLDPPQRSDDPMRLPPLTQTVARRHVQSTLKKLRRSGTSGAAAVVDCDGSKCHLMHGVSPCLTKSRAAAGGHWLVSRGRRMSVTEMERLFGYHIQPPNGGKPVSLKRPRKVSDRQWGALLGNSIPVPLLVRVLCRALPAASLSHPLPDIWQRGN